MESAITRREVSRTPSGRRRDLPPPLVVGDPVCVTNCNTSVHGRVVAIERHAIRANSSRIQVRLADGSVEWHTRDRVAFFTSRKIINKLRQDIQQSWRNPLLRDAMGLPPRSVSPLLHEPLTTPVMSVSELVGIIQSASEG